MTCTSNGYNSCGVGDGNGDRSIDMAGSLNAYANHRVRDGSLFDMVSILKGHAGHGVADLYGILDATEGSNEHVSCRVKDRDRSLTADS